MKVVITGSRDYPLPTVVRARIGELPAGTLVIVGRARGVDTIAEKAALEAGLPVHAEPVNWEVTPETRITRSRFDGTVYDAEAGKHRNIKMLEMLDPEREDEYVIAFHDGKSPGTAHCIREARMRRISVEYWGPNGEMT